MPTQMLSISNTQCNVSAVTPVSCNIGDEKETRISLCLVFLTKAEHLDQFKKGLRRALFAKLSKAQRAQQEEAQQEMQGDMLPDPDAELIEPRFAGALPSITWGEVYEGYTIALGSGLSATQPRVFDGVKIKNFTIWAQSSGIIKIKCSVLIATDQPSKGWLCDLLRHDMQLWLTPPGEQLTLPEGEEEAEEVEA